MYKKLKEKINLYIIRKPRNVIITTIIVLNILILIASSMIINFLMKDSVGDLGFWKTIYYTFGMILDAGMMENIVSDIGTASTVLVVICIITIVVGSITFTGAVIGYVTNYISSFIDNANTNSRPIRISDHIVIINWNSRASEIINDILFLNRKETIIVLVDNGAERVNKEINERIYLTLKDEKIRNKLEIIVREGNTYSTKQLNDISLSKAKTIIILGDDDINSACKYDLAEQKQNTKQNTNTIKTLIQVSEITSAETSADNQKIVVEIEDDWTGTIVNKIIEHKEKLGKCNIVALPVNKILGQLLSQFCIFPELNNVYSNLFSNKGAEFFCVDETQIDKNKNESEAVEQLFNTNSSVIPLSFMDTKSGRKFFYMAEKEENICHKGSANRNLKVEVNKAYWLGKKNVVILGHNSNIREIMSGFEAFRCEWNIENDEILNIMVIDDKKNLEKLNYYKDYSSYVKKVVEAEIYETDKVKKEIVEFVDANVDDTSILILSDDRVQEKDIDSYPLINLVCVQEILKDKLKQNPAFDVYSIDIIVEILNPKNYDVVHNYNIENIVISNRYISKMVTQISEKIELYEFYSDILTYDTEENLESGYESKEVYVKPVDGYLNRYPSKCNAYELVRAIYEDSPANNKGILLGIAHSNGTIELFENDQRNYDVDLQKTDKLILFSNH